MSSIKIKQIRGLQRKFALFYYHSFVDTPSGNPYSSGSKHCCVVKLGKCGIPRKPAKNAGACSLSPHTKSYWHFRCLKMRLFG